MAFYQTETRLERIDIDRVGFDPESGDVTVYLRRVIDVADSIETVWVDHTLHVSLELLTAMAESGNALARAMEEEGMTEFDIRKPSEVLA